MCDRTGDASALPWLTALITYYKIARCRSYSHVLGTLIWGRCECRVRSLLAVVRSQRLCSPTFCPFRYRIPGCLAKVPSAFVGGTPLICPLRHRHKFHFLIWWFVTDNLHPGHLSTIVSRLRCVVLHFFLFPIMSEHATRQSERIRNPSYRRRTTWRLPEIVSVRISVVHPYLSLVLMSFSLGCFSHIYYKSSVKPCDIFFRGDG